MKQLATETPPRFITAASLFDGHDASINIMRRVLQDHGAEVIHLGHNRSVQDVVEAALQEGAHAIAISSYQGGHVEYFKYMKDLLNSEGAHYVKIFGGGGGVIVHEEKALLEKYGISQIFHPEDGRRLGLDGMIGLMMKEARYNLPGAFCSALKSPSGLAQKGLKKEFTSSIPHGALGAALSALEEGLATDPFHKYLENFRNKTEHRPLVMGITGTGGAGKSSLIDELVQRFLNSFPGIKIGVVCVDPTKRRTGGALLGDRIRMNSLSRPGTFMRSVASRGSGTEIAQALPRFLDFLKDCDFDLLIAESSGIGQASTAIIEVSDFSLYVMTSEFGAQSQLEKIDMIDYADLICINKADHRGSQDALQQVEKQYRRSRKKFDFEIKVPVYLSQASHFNDEGVNQLFEGICEILQEKSPKARFWGSLNGSKIELLSGLKQTIVPSHRQNYLAEIVEKVEQYKKKSEEWGEMASRLGAMEHLCRVSNKEKELKGEQEASLFHGGRKKELEALWKAEIPSEMWSQLQNWENLAKTYQDSEYVYKVRGQEVRQPLRRESLSGLNIPRVVFPKIKDWGDRLRFLRKENLPGFSLYRRCFSSEARR